ncbi:hypothetical protein ES703_73612 [subsurface metagenome]
MTGIRMQLGAIAAVFAAMGYSMPSPATALVSIQDVSQATDFSSVQRGGRSTSRACPEHVLVLGRFRTDPGLLGLLHPALLMPSVDAASRLEDAGAVPAGFDKLAN